MSVCPIKAAEDAECEELPVKVIEQGQGRDKPTSEACRARNECVRLAEER
jgi:hypothetical protein